MKNSRLIRHAPMPRQRKSMRKISFRKATMTKEDAKAMRILDLETQLEKAVAYADELMDTYLKASGKLQAELAQANDAHEQMEMMANQLHKELTESGEKIKALRDSLSHALVSHDLITKGVCGDLQLNELYALEKGGFFVTLVSPKENYYGEGETPLDAILKALGKVEK